ncbi:signal peptidase II [Acidaminobacter sp. JC074]|uniref:signal peptidase II n=1 Tax=Acidaminobacter sp. JC074 TaxID=2530199 RepID=UPI001F0DCF7E|nr:signal peptidase II [Acidaminobacter sp. JC074]MCH4888477.1 signal peptidase II [Acidaminobacter sp. JC074]
MKKSVFFIFTALLIAVEQIIKIIINSNFLHNNDVIIENLLYFKPMFNRDYSWINSLFQLGVAKWPHVIMVAFIMTMVFLVYMFIDHKGYNSKPVSTAFAFLLAGGVCSFVDKIFWDGSLDYIYLQGQFTFDLKDVYINIFIGLMILMFIFDHQGIRTSDEDHFIKDFKDYVLRRK